MGGEPSAGGGVDGERALAQGVALGHAEAVLLVDDDEPQEGHLDGLGQQGVRAHDDDRLPGGELGEDPAAGGGGRGAGQQVDAGGALGPAEHASARQWAQERAERGVVLGGEDLGGGEQGRLAAAPDDLQHGAQGHERLAGADVALEEALHGHGRVERGGELGADPLLPGGQCEGQGGVEVGAQGVGPWHGPGDGGAGRLVLGAAPGQGRLEDEGLLVAQAAARGPPLPGVLGPVDPAVGGEGVDEAVGGAHRLGQGLGHVAGGEAVQDGAHDPGHLQAGQGLGGGVDGDGAGQEGLPLGLVHVLEDLQARGGQLLAPVVEADPPGQQHGGAGGELLGVVIHEAHAAEEDHLHVGRAVGDDGLHEGGRAAGARAPGEGPHHLHLHGGLLAVGQRAQIGQIAPGVVAARQEAQQPADGGHALLGEPVGGALAHQPGQGGVDEGDRAPAGAGGAGAGRVVGHCGRPYSTASRTSGRACPPA